MNAPFHAPRLRPLSPRKAALISVVDLGTAKVACLIASLQPLPAAAASPGRTHRARVLGVGHHRSRGLKGGQIVDLELAEQSIRHAVDAAERMAGVQVESLIVSLSGARVGSQLFTARVAVDGRAIGDGAIHRVLEAACAAGAGRGRATLHALPMGFGVDDALGVRDPRGMAGRELGADLHVVSCDAGPARNLMLAVERCHLGVEALVAGPYAAGLATLTEDEAELGAAVVDFGAGTTSVGVFHGGRLSHADAIAVGGSHVTMDVARGLGVPMAEAERLKTLHGAVHAAASDERDMLALEGAAEDGPPHYVARAQLVRIVRPRVEEILELVRDRLTKAGFAAQAGRRVVLTGGASQLTGLADLARHYLAGDARIGRPSGVDGLPEAARSPAFAVCAGLVVYPQAVGLEHFEPSRGRDARAFAGDGYVSRVGRWLKESF